MGIIQQQALRNTIISFVGIAFGSVTRLLMPFVLQSAQIGIVALIDSISGVFVIFFNMGYNLILKKLFPTYRNEDNGHAGFLIYGILITVVGMVIGIGVYFFTEDYLLSSRGRDGDLLRPYAYLIPIVIFFRTLFLNIDGYVRMLFKTIVGTFLDGLVSKLILLTAILLVLYSFIDFQYFVYLYCFTLAFPGIVIVFYAFHKTKKIVLPSRDLWGESSRIKSYVLFGVLSGSAASIIQYSDVLMINKLTLENPESQVGIYSVMFFAALLISIPAKNINRISSVVLAESWKEKDLENVQDIYTKSAGNLFVVGTFLFIIGWACIDSALVYLPEYAVGKYVFFFLGLARLVELGTGVNAEIIEVSEKYRFNTYFNLALAALVIGFNFVFIQQYGIVGAAFATMLAMIIINFLRALLLKKVYNLWPFNRTFYKLMVVATAFITAISFIDYDANPIAKIIINTGVVSALFWFIVIRFRLSPEISDWLLKIKRTYLK